MKHSWFKKLSLTLVLFSFQAFADERENLQNILFANDGFRANFEQIVTKQDGSIVAKSSGNLALKRPDKLILNTVLPDEQVLFSVDENVYFYDAFVNQVSIFSKSSLYTSPFLLLSSKDKKVWDSYEVSFKDDIYCLKPKAKGELKQVLVNTKGGTINSLEITLKDGNINTYNLSNLSYSVSDDIFNYQIPKDAQVDDER